MYKNKEFTFSDLKGDLSKFLLEYKCLDLEYLYFLNNTPPTHPPHYIT